jgi:hypothetical protein
MGKAHDLNECDGERRAGLNYNVDLCLILSINDVSINEESVHIRDRYFQGLFILQELYPSFLVTNGGSSFEPGMYPTLPSEQASKPT